MPMPRAWTSQPPELDNPQVFIIYPASVIFCYSGQKRRRDSGLCHGDPGTIGPSHKEPGDAQSWGWAERKDEDLWTSEAKEKPSWGGGCRTQREGEEVGSMRRWEEGEEVGSVRNFRGSGQPLYHLYLEWLGSH